MHSFVTFVTMVHTGVMRPSIAVDFPESIRNDGD